MPRVTVLEYARLTTDRVPPSLHLATITQSAFDWLCRESGRLCASGAALVQVGDRRWLRLDNYVGVVETPCGTQLEILPKHVDGEDQIASARRLLRKMLSRCLDLPVREAEPSDIQAFDAPLNEWVIRRFLDGLERLVKRGVRFDYHRVGEEQRFLRGRLDLARQLRQSPVRRHVFQIEHDVYDADRAENRLLCSALDRVCRMTRDARNWRLSHELATYLAPVPRSTNYSVDFRAWRSDRHVAHYRGMRPWCSLILNEQTPLSIVGQWNGVSLLFPMEKVFERYVGACLRRDLATGVSVTAPAANKYLCTHLGQPWFQLKPDFLLKQDPNRWVLDTKWKRLDAAQSDGGGKYGISQADFYQLFAYGKHYLDGRGDLFLIYPMTADFREPLPEFRFDANLRLWVIPFDLERGALVGSTGTSLPLRTLLAA